jgi:septum formation protein
MGIPLLVVPGDVDETRRHGEGSAEYLSRIVRDKLLDVVRRLAERPFPGVLVADTIVVVDDDILGKPRNVAEAEELVSRLVGRSHIVRTRYALSVAPRLAHSCTERTVETRVTMRTASKGEIAAYAKTGEGLDKAGAYAAQGVGAFLIRGIEGSFSNVVGLPACEVVEDLVSSGLLDEYPRAAP